jgi:hypothetical protein
MKTNLCAVVLSGLLVIPSIPSPRGGWAVVTVENLPDYAVAGRTLPLTFAVRQHGRTMLSGLKPSVEIRSDGPATQFPALAGDKNRHKAARPQGKRCPEANDDDNNNNG